METSSLSELLNTEVLELVERELTYLDDEHELLTFFYDSMNDVTGRVRVLYQLQKKNIDLCIETTNKILSQFNFMYSSLNYELICEIVKHKDIDLNLRINAIESLYNYNKEDGWKFYNEITSEDTFTDLSYPLKTECLKYLLETERYYDDTVKKVSFLVTCEKYECEYRYKSLFRLTKESNTPLYKKYMYDVHILFINNKNVYTQYKILASQYILQNFQEKEDILSLLSSLASDSELDYNLRADASDILVRFGTGKYKELGKDIIMLLGKDSSKLRTVYNNRQNVHAKEIDQSIRQIVLEIAGMKTKENKHGKIITYNEITEEIRKGVKDKNTEDKLNSSLLRIELDQTIYEGGQTLSSIFIKIYHIVETHPEREQLYNRLVEELVDMADTCSSGHLSRLINVLSGYEIDGKSYSVTIGWKEQIKSNLIARLSHRIKEDKYYDKCEKEGCKKISNYSYEHNKTPVRCSIHKEGEMIDYRYIQEEDIETIRERILEDLSTTGSIKDKVYISYFFRKNLLDIREELFREFVPEYITEETFEEHIRSAICEFEGEN